MGSCGRRKYWWCGEVFCLAWGIVLADTLLADEPIELLIYSNRPEAWEKKQPEVIIPFKTEWKGNITYRADFSAEVNIRPGLHYIVIGRPQPAGGHLPLWFGKFTVREK